MMMKPYYIIIYFVLFAYPVFSQNMDNRPVHEYHLALGDTIVNITGKERHAMAINGSVPGPTLQFTEGEYAVIYVKNNMAEETSLHWHGLLLPNFQDGVPYLTTPPILPGKTQKFEFPIIHSGTYWYHSHTMLQEQSGVYGSIVIKPQKQILEYSKELVLVLSDWTNEKPMSVLRNLKRGNEWYGNRKGTATPLNRAIKRGALGAQINFWKQRMEGADIADIFYDAFLINGQQTSEYPDFKPGEKVRLRFINAAASTYFWLTFGGNKMPLLVASDGVDVVPIMRNKTIIAVAETYDFIITVPPSGKLEIRATAQDGSGFTSTYIGQGEILKAPIVPRPDKIGMMKTMAKMDMKMGAPALKFKPKKDEPQKLMNKYGMQMDMDSDMQNMDMPGDDKNNMQGEKEMDMENKNDMENKGKTDMKKETDMTDMKNTEPDKMQGMDKAVTYDYNYLKSPEKTNYDKGLPVKKILLNLTGNMNRYIWSLNGIPLSETDKIKIKKGEVTRITLNNLTMMHHPMHLHGHFFRVLNDKGEYAPMKHTVNVPPMQKVTIEFYGNETGDWFFHCHILYHMMGGMARVFSYDTPRDTRLDKFPISKLIHETDAYYTWGMVDIASQMSAVNIVSSNIRNQFNLSAEFGYNENMEAEATYERYLYDYLTIFGGINVENEIDDSFAEISTTAIAGIRFFTPYMFNLDVRLDNQLRPQISLSRAIMIFPKLSVFGEYEYQADFGLVNDFPDGEDYQKDIVWNAGAEYMLSRNFSVLGSYDNRFGGGGGISIRF
ncbi:MAG TPA: copper oxidase [Bacteroidetes bacterium]|nr:copper oxidase [Bacteroidota bacterium]